METAVRKATRLEYRPPKEKHLITLKAITFDNPAIIDSMLGCLEKRLKERSWIITYKVLEILHYLMREGNSVRVIDAVIKRPEVMDTTKIKNKSSTPTNVQNIYLYRAYLDERILAFKHLERDFIHEAKQKGGGRLRHLRVSDGLLKETAALQRQMDSALKCKFYLDERDPQITFFAYRMVIDDILALFQSMNEGVVNILEHYFEMQKSDAKQALDIYKTFAQQTELTIEYLNSAKRLEGDLQMGIPSIKHAPLSLATALEEYLNDENKDEQQPKAKSPTQTQRFSQQPQQQQFNQQPQFNTQPQQQQFQPYQSNLAPQNDPFMPRNDPFMPQPQNIMVAPVNRQITNVMDQNTQVQQPQMTSNPFLSMINQQNTGMMNQQNTGLMNQQNTGMMNQQNTGMMSQSMALINQQNTGMNMVNQQNTGMQMLNQQNTGSPFNPPPNRYSTLPSIGGSSSNSNPFRSLTNNNSNLNRFSTVSYNSPMKQNSLPVASTHHSNNPFSPMTPPLTPNQPLQQQQTPNPFAQPNNSNLYRQNTMF